MTRIPTLLAALLIIAAVSLPAVAQDLSPEQIAAAEKAFQTANTLMDNRKYAEALTIYKPLLATVGNNPAVLYNSGIAAFATKDFEAALDMWKKAKDREPKPKP